MMSHKDTATLALVRGLSIDQVIALLVQQGLNSEAAQVVAAQAKDQVSSAADFDRREKTGLAVRRLESIYTNATSQKDFRTALQAQRELTKLCGLLGRDSSPDLTTVDDGDGARLAVIAGYLLPLSLTDPSYPVEEHARIAAELIRSHGLIQSTR